MTTNNDDSYDDLDAFDPDYMPGDDDFDFEPADDPVKAVRKPRTAWQKIEHRREMSWLRDQTADWDYWDEFLQSH